MRTTALRRIASPFLVSLALHAAILIAWLVLAMQQATDWHGAKRQELTWIEIQETPKPPVPRQRSEDVAERSRVVQTKIQNPTQEAPKNAFLGEVNQAVDRERVASSSSVGGASHVAQRPQESTAKQAAESPSRSPALPLSQLGALQIQVLQRRDLSPRPEWAPQLGVGEGAPREYVEGFEKGESTALNTREYVFYGYFQRIRQRLDIAWTKQLRSQLERFYRRGRALASDLDYTTKTLVTLNGTGEIVKVQVLQESGAIDLDQAAVDAFNRAGPFPNPPKGVVDARGLIEIRWDFVVRN